MLVVEKAEIADMASSSQPPKLCPPVPSTLSCDSCGATIAWRKPGKLRVRVASKYLFVRTSDGVAEVTCERCGEDVDLPLRIVR